MGAAGGQLGARQRSNSPPLGDSMPSAGVAAALLDKVGLWSVGPSRPSHSSASWLLPTGNIGRCCRALLPASAPPHCRIDAAGECGGAGRQIDGRQTGGEAPAGRRRRRWRCQAAAQVSPAAAERKRAWRAADGRGARAAALVFRQHQAGRHGPAAAARCHLLPPSQRRRGQRRQP